jgi:thymidylate synthase
MRVKDIRNQFVKKYKEQKFEIDKNGGKVIDLICAQFIADESFIFGIPNENYIKRELNWYLSQSLNVNDIENTPTIWKQVADKDGFINSNYGWCIFSKDNGYQYDNCLRELKNQTSSRRGAMIYNRPNMWEDYNKNGRSDFMCTYAVQFLIRDNILYSYVLMRSNDAWAGYRNDYAWHKYVMNKLGDDLNIKKRAMIWNSGSLHLYEKQFYLLDHYIKTGIPSITHAEYEKMYGQKTLL